MRDLYQRTKRSHSGMKCYVSSRDVQQSIELRVVTDIAFSYLKLFQDINECMNLYMYSSSSNHNKARQNRFEGFLKEI